jgi:hypothetical protein
MTPDRVELTGIRLRNNTSANAATRDAAYPAPTMYFGARCNTMTWEVDDPGPWQQSVDTDGEGA